MCGLFDSAAAIERMLVYWKAQVIPIVLIVYSFSKAIIEGIQHSVAMNIWWDESGNLHKFERERWLYGARYWAE